VRAEILRCSWGVHERDRRYLFVRRALQRLSREARASGVRGVVRVRCVSVVNWPQIGPMISSGLFRRSSRRHPDRPRRYVLAGSQRLTTPRSPRRRNVAVVSSACTSPAITSHTCEESSTPTNLAQQLAQVALDRQRIHSRRHAAHRRLVLKALTCRRGRIRRLNRLSSIRDRLGRR